MHPTSPPIPPDTTPGFTPLMAVFTWLSGLAIPQAMLILGQALNALAVVAVYLFAASLTGSRLAGVIAALACGVFTPMPAYLTSWGRYTQLTGLLILPAAQKLLNLSFTNLEGSDRALRKITWRHPAVQWLLLAAIACAGMFLTHYRVLAFFAFLAAAELVVLAARALFYPGLRSSLWRNALTIGSAAVLAVLLSLPWWPETLRTLFTPFLGYKAAAPVAFSDFSWNYLTTASGTAVMGAAALGLLIALIRQRWFATTLIIWLGLLIFSANLAVFGLPGSSFINNTSVEIMLYIPLSVLAGYALSETYTWLVNVLPQTLIKAAQGLCILLLAAVSLVGGARLVPILNPVTLLVRQADLPALQWVAENIPANETVLINPFAWGYGLYAGNDGGFWITPITGRKTLPPPVLYGVGDAANWQNVEAINAQLKQITGASSDPGRLAQAMKQAGVRYLYLGARGGIFSAEILRNSSAFNVLYNQNGVWVVEVR